LNFPETQSQSLIAFSEADVVQVFRQTDLEVKNQLHQIVMKVSVSIETLTIPIPSQLFIDHIHSSISLLSHILGLNDDGRVTEVMLGILLYLVRHFKYQAYMFSLIICSNRRALEGMDSEVFSDWP